MPAARPVFCAAKEMPGSTTQTSELLHRERSVVKRDVDELARARLVTASEKALPCRDRMKDVRATAVRIA